MAERDVLRRFEFARLARQAEDLGWVRNRTRVQRRRAVEVSTGLDLDNVAARVMGVVSEEYLEKVRQDTRRGLRGAFERKLATGGTPYGYRSVPIVVGEDAHGHLRVECYRLEVEPERAAVVVRLFEGYALQGLGLRTLAHEVNLFRNPIYRGERIWNRSVWVKDHETGRRHRYERPESE